MAQLPPWKVWWVINSRITDYGYGWIPTPGSPATEVMSLPKVPLDNVVLHSQLKASLYQVPQNYICMCQREFNRCANICWITEKERVQKNIYFFFTDYAKAFDCVDHNKLWKILREMVIPGHLICLLRNLYAHQEATVRIRHGTTDWFQIGKGVRQGCILSPCLFSLYAEYIMRNTGLDEAQA